MTAESQRQFKVYHGPSGDFLRTAAGNVRLFSDLKDAQAFAEQQGGFVLAADAPSPGGFDRTWA